MRLRDAISQAVERLKHEPIGPPRMAAETLMMFALGSDRAHLYAYPERQLTDAEWQKFHDAVEQRASGKPLQYIIGHQEFWGLDFLVSPAVLIPRPETEHSVEEALVIATQTETPWPRIVDVGTGSGCIALALASELPNAEIHALDISEEALRVARQNAEHLKLAERVKFQQSDLLSAFANEPESFDLVVSNPPYVGRNEADKVQKEVRDHEPDVAVFGGEEGMDIYRRLIPQAHAALKPQAWLILEIGYSIEAPVRALLDSDHWRNVEAVPDLQGIPRVIKAQKI